ncbi:MAG: carboxylating nicotinate-nucleotide diphosphorylase [Halobacteriales archaeon]|nr:carboxylating nicotinate-nucleotide diphosphorylase [Halobacteriales archaeon]
MREQIDSFLREDVPDVRRDISSTVVEGETAEATVVTRDDGVVAGVEEACAVFSRLGAEANPRVEDGERTDAGDVVLEPSGDAVALLRGERLALNLLGSMSGTATATRECVDAVEETDTDTTVAGTRKTTPGYREFEKRAVRLGGGDPHRHDLTDAVMLKENHLELVGLETAFRRAKEGASFTTKIDVEAEDLHTAERAAELGADIVLLDNMTPDEVAEAVERLDGTGVTVEASGGITSENVAEYARAGADVVSIGSLVHSSDWLDLSMRVE